MYGDHTFIDIYKHRMVYSIEYLFNYLKMLFFDTDLAWIETDHAHVNVLNRGDLSSLTWLQSPIITNTNTDNPNLDTCTVHYASLNFRDIMLATGKLSPEAIPGKLNVIQFENISFFFF